MTEYAALTRIAASARPSLGERVRQLRIARGLTQTDLAGDRFSKEYVSQIERGKTRPTRGDDRMARRAARRRLRPSSRSASPPASASGSRASSPAPRRRSRRASTRTRWPSWTQLAPVLPTLAAPELELRARSRRGVVPHVPGRGPQGARGPRPCAQARRGADRSPTSTAPQVLFHLALLPVQAQLDLDRPRPLHAVARARRALRASPPTASARTSTSGARAATSASATGRPRRRTSSAPSSSPKA